MAENYYAQILKEQGSYVINVDGIDWYEYNGFMMPAYLPHCTPDISPEVARKALRISKQAFIRWDTKYNNINDSEWWYILKKGPWSIEDIKDKKKRWMIRQGKKRFSVRVLTSEEVLSECPRVAMLAASRYKGTTDIETYQVLKKRLDAAEKISGVLEYLGCFHENKLVSFSECFFQENAVWLSNMRHDPNYLKDYSSYGFLDGILDYYLNQRKLEYVLDGSRTIHHKTNFQEHLIKVFGFTKEYANINVLYSSRYKLAVKAAYPFINIIQKISDKWTIDILDKISGILKQEFIRRSCIVKEEACPVFITYGWCRSSYAVACSLGSRGIDVHIGDTSPFAMTRFSKHCKTFIRLPDFFIEPEKYFEEVCEALKKTGAKVLLPGHEDVGIFCRHKDRLPEGVHLAIPEMDSYNIAEDKFSIVEIAREIGCPAAETHQIFSKEQLEEKAETINYPLIVKARAGNSAKGVRIAKNKKDLFTKFDELVDVFELDKDRWPILQELLPGEAAGVCVVYDHGKCVASFAEKYLRCKNPNRFGTSTLREVFKNEELVNHAIGIMDKLHWHGIAHLDFVADKDGVFKLIEINPRLWGALSLAIHSGVDFPYLWYLQALGKKCGDSKFNIKPMKSRWIVGDAMAFVGLLKALKILEAFKVFKPELACVHDDFSFGDPLPFVFEIIDYLTKFVKAGFSTNPVTENMIH